MFCPKILDGEFTLCGGTNMCSHVPETLCNMQHANVHHTLHQCANETLIVFI